MLLKVERHHSHPTEHLQYKVVHKSIKSNLSDIFHFTRLEHNGRKRNCNWLT